MASVMTTPHVMSAAPAMRMMVIKPIRPPRASPVISLAELADAFPRPRACVGADA